MFKTHICLILSLLIFKIAIQESPKCDENRPIFNETLGICQKCENNLNCLETDINKPICLPLLGTCRSCNDSSECLFHDGEYPICSKGRCVSCENDYQCFNRSFNLCIDSKCVGCEIDSQCSIFDTHNITYKCYTGINECHIKCKKNEDCLVDDGNDHFCNTTSNECYVKCPKSKCGDPDDIVGLIIAFSVGGVAFILFIVLFCSLGFS